MSVNTKDPDWSSSDLYVSGYRTAVLNDAIAPKLDPIRQRPEVGHQRKLLLQLRHQLLSDPARVRAAVRVLGQPLPDR